VLIRLLYVSRAVGPQTTTVTATILTAARARNRELGVTGVLCQGQGLYLQVLEGERRDVNALYTRIVTDRRHRDVELLRLEETDARRFADWSMALVELSDGDSMVQLQRPGFDPYAARGAFVMTMVDELVRDGARIEPPDL
jgi:hypothetical protein